MNTKKKIGISLMVIAVSILFALPVMAEDAALSNGFYNIGSANNVLIKAFVGDEEAQLVSKDVDADTEAEDWYADSDRIEVSYSAATEGGYYGAILVEGTDLPTVDDEIFFIDQVTAGSEDIHFNVYPRTPEATTGMTLYISSSIYGEDLISIPLGYAVGVGGLSYTLGDVDGDGFYGVKDALIVLQIGVGKYQATDAEKAAADVDGDGFCGVKDALLILQYGTGKINSFK